MLAAIPPQRRGVTAVTAFPVLHSALCVHQLDVLLQIRFQVELYATEGTVHLEGAMKRSRKGRRRGETEKGGEEEREGRRREREGGGKGGEEERKGWGGGKEWRVGGKEGREFVFFWKRR